MFSTLFCQNSVADIIFCWNTILADNTTTCMTILTWTLVSACVPSLRGFSSAATSFLKTGDILKRARIFTSEDVLNYSKVSQDSNPLHFNSESAQNAGFEDRVVHGMLVAALFPKIISSHFPGAVYVSQSLHFRSPVYIGEEIVGEVQAINIREQKNRYLAKFKTACFKDGSVVIDGEAMAILPTLAVEEEDTL